MATATPVREARPDHNSLGRAAFIVGLIGLVMSFIPIIGFVSWLLAPLAVLFGLIALLKAPRSLAIAGIVTGLLALFICFSWVKGTQGAIQAMNKDTFNNSGAVVDNANAPIAKASVMGLWKELDENKIAAGKKYGGHRLAFTSEAIEDFGGDAANPSISFVGKRDQFVVYSVSAAFSASDGEKISTFKKGQKISFVCRDIKETLGDGYSLANCVLN
jgi:predicted heme/steroid binding protein